MSDESFPCPICERPVTAAVAAFPFCSRRCRLIDLGRWIEGEYTIEGRPGSALEEEERAPSPAGAERDGEPEDDELDGDELADQGTW